MGETAPTYKTGDIGQRLLPAPVMARRRETDAKARLREATSALDASRGIHFRIQRAIRAAEITTGESDIQSIEGHVEAAIICLQDVAKAAREARGGSQAVLA